MYRERRYREWVRAEDLVKTHVSEEETDLLILAEKDVSKPALEAIRKYRSQIEEFIITYPKFKTSLKPLNYGSRTPIIKEMIKVSKRLELGQWRLWQEL